MARGGLFSIGVGLFLAGGGLFLSPTVAEKSPTPAEKSPTAIPKRCWTSEYSGELEFSSPFIEQWTLDARGVLCFMFKVGGGFKGGKPLRPPYLLCMDCKPSRSSYKRRGRGWNSDWRGLARAHQKMTRQEKVLEICIWHI